MLETEFTLGYSVKALVFVIKIGNQGRQNRPSLRQGFSHRPKRCRRDCYVPETPWWRATHTASVEVDSTRCLHRAGINR